MIRVALILGLWATSATADDLDLSAAGTPTRTVTSPAASLRLPVAAWSPDTTVNVREGALRRSVYQYLQSSRTTLQLIQPVRRILEDAGYETVFACADVACGGFDFRFQLDLLPEPDMHVDLGNYRYLLMEKEGATPHTVSLVASATINTGFLHISEVSEPIVETAVPATQPDPITPEPNEPPPEAADMISALTSEGRVVLTDVEFQTGAAVMGAGPLASLSSLARWLSDNPSARVVLVGHTDAVGSLENNTLLSRRRAAAVEARLIGDYGVDRTQLQSAGAGFLAPVATNLTPEGRSANRRVEVVLLSLE
ncbi:MAG: OmpA family protein [Pseudomonadota bacterium]